MHHCMFSKNMQTLTDIFLKVAAIQPNTVAPQSVCVHNNSPGCQDKSENAFFQTKYSKYQIFC